MSINAPKMQVLGIIPRNGEQPYRDRQRAPPSVENTSYDVQIVTIGPTVSAQLTLLFNPQWAIHCLKVPLAVGASAPLSNAWFPGSK